MSLISAKIIFDDDLRRVSLSKSTTLDELIARFAKTFELEEDLAQCLRLTFVDDEEDVVTIGSDEDLVEAFSVARQLKHSLRVTANVDRAKVHELMKAKWIEKRNQFIEERKKQCQLMRERYQAMCAQRCGADSSGCCSGAADPGEVCQSRTTAPRLYFGLQQRSLALLEENTTESLKQAIPLLKLQEKTAPSVGDRPSLLWTPLYNLACAYALLGETEAAFDYLKKAVAAGWDDYEHMKVDEDLASLHGLPEFVEILKELGDDSEETAEEKVEKEEVAAVEENSQDLVKIEDEDDEEEVPELSSEEVKESASLSTSSSAVSELDRNLKILAEMGWNDRRANISALLESRNDIVRAVEVLLGSQ